MNKNTSKIITALCLIVSILLIVNLSIVLVVGHEINQEIKELSDTFWAIRSSPDCTGDVCLDKLNTIIRREARLIEIEVQCSLNGYCLLNSEWDRV